MEKDYWVKVSFMNSGYISIPTVAKDNFTAIFKVLKRYKDEEKEIIGVQITYVQPDMPEPKANER